ncbi:C40 family peptidase [Conyzicola nivalis]|uniref:C40 family peptidase n=1 Tax=Conyzicola nivalis TaxID=1477021 RepID=UPI00166C7F74|nr:C40 family peptidase [Conyzicola nivalis]
MPPENSATEIPKSFTSRRGTPSKKRKRRSSVLSLAVVAVVVPGLFATVALPAYAFAPVEDTDDLKAAVALEEYKEADAQTVLVDKGAEEPSTDRESFSATTEAELAASRKRTVLAATYASYAGPSTAEFLANPPYPSFDLAQVAAVGQQYLGTPYIYGGADPSGFDCSGFVQYVYAQFGIALPHSVSGQAAAGTRIATADALPGDIVIMSGHDGIYMGDGKIMDAPHAGGVVSIRPIWTTSYYIVRIGV